MKFNALWMAQKDHLPGHDLSWLAEKRHSALSFLHSQEEWLNSKKEEKRHTSFVSLFDTPWKMPVKEMSPPRILLENTPANDVIVTDIGTAIQKYPQYVEPYLQVDTASLETLNTAFFHQGFFILIPSHVCLETPIEIQHPALLDGQMACYRNYIFLEEGAEATVIESFFHTTVGRSFNFSCTEAYLQSHAKLTHYKQQQDTAQTFHLSQLNIYQKKHSQAQSYVMSLGDGWIRSDTHVYLEEENAACTLYGLTLGAAKQVVDHQAIITHSKPQGSSKAYYKGILKDQAKGLFNGKVVVSPDAIHTDAIQHNKTLLLSREAQMNTHPQLEIFSDDVKCAHGATIGQLEEEALFYLRARGIDEITAKQLLIEAFLGDILEAIPLASIKNSIQTYLPRYLARAN